MAELDTVATAFVSIIPTFEGGLGKLLAELTAGTTSAATEAGEGVGKGMSNGARSGLAGISNTVNEALAKSAGSASESGATAGTRFSESLAKSATSGLGEIDAKVSSALRGAGEGATAAGESAGRDFAKGLSAGASTGEALAGVASAEGKLAESTRAARAAEDEASASTGRFSGLLGKAQGTVSGFGEHIKGMGKEVAGFAGIIGGVEVAKFMGESIKGAGELQRETQVIQNASGDVSMSVKKMSDGIMSVSNQTGASLDQTSKGLYSVEAAGFKGKSAMDVLSAGMKGAADEGADSQTVINGLTTIMRDYGIKSQDSAKAMNLMLVASGNTKASLQEFSGSLASVFPTASALGLKLPEVAAAISTMTQQGFSAQRSTQDLNHAIMSLTNPTAAQAKAMKSIGLSAGEVSDSLGKKGLQATLQMVSDTLTSKMSGSAKNTAADLAAMSPKARGLAQSFADGTETAGQLEKAMKKLPPSQQKLIADFMPGAKNYVGQLAAMTGGNTSLLSALALTGKGAKESMDKLTKANTEAIGSTKDLDEKFDKTAKTASMAWQILENRIKNAGVQIATAVLPTLSTLAVDLTSMIGKAEGFASANSAWLGPLTKGLGVMAGAFLAGFAAMKTFEKGQAIFSNISKAVSGAQSMIQKLLKSQLASTAATEAATGANEGLAASEEAVEAANPFGLIIAAIAGVSFALYEAYEHFSGFRTLVNTVFHAVEGVVKEAWSVIKTGTGDVVSFVSAHWRPIAAILLAPFAPFIAVAVGAFEVVKAALPGVEGAFRAIVPKIAAALSGIVSSVRGMVSGITSGIHMLAPLWNWMIGGVTGLVRSLAPLWGLIVGAARSMVGWFTGSFLPTLTRIWGQLKPPIESFGRFFETVAKAVMSVARVMETVFSTVGKAIGDYLRVLGTIFSVEFKLMGAAIAAMVAVAGVAFRLLASVIRDLVIPVIRTILSTARPIFSAVGTLVTSTMRIIGDVISVALNLITGHWRNAWNSAKDILSTAFHGALKIVSDVLDAIKRAVTGGLSDVVGFFAKLPGDIMHSLGDLGNLLFNAGKDVINGLTNGINSAAGDVFHAVSNIGDEVSSTFKSVMSIFSPSRRMADISQWIPKGIAKGIDDHAHHATNAVTAIGNKLAKTKLAVPGVTVGAPSVKAGGLLGLSGSTLHVSASGATNFNGGHKTMTLDPASVGPLARQLAQGLATPLAKAVQTGAATGSQAGISARDNRVARSASHRITLGA